MNLKYQVQRGIRNLNYLIDHILYQIFKTIMSISSKNMKQWLIIRVYVNEIEKRIKFEIKTGYYLDFLRPSNEIAWKH